MERLWLAWAEHPCNITLVFFRSIPHARDARDGLRERGVRVEAVFSAPGSGDSELCLAQLANGDLDALCVVDIFNEGVDVQQSTGWSCSARPSRPSSSSSSLAAACARATARTS